jgi:hypothetical protein
MSEALNLCREYFQGIQVEASQVDAHSLVVPVQIRDHLLQGLLTLRPESGWMVLYVTTSVQVPDHRRTAVGEFLGRVNYLLPIGNFEMDWEDGEVRFRIGTALESQPNPAPLVEAASFMADRYFPALFKVALEGYSPLRALAEIA